MLNYLIVSGVLGRDPEVGQGQDDQGQGPARFSLGFPASGDRTARLPVVCHDSLAEAVRQCLGQGDTVVVAGALDQEPENGLRLVGRSVEYMATDRCGNTRLTPLGSGFSGHRNARAKSGPSLERKCINERSQ